MAMVGRHDACSTPAAASLRIARARLSMTVSITCRAWNVKPRLAGVVDLLRAHHDDLGAIDLLGELRRLQAQELVERDISQVRHARGGEFLPSRKVGKKRGVDARTERAALLDDAEA